MSTLRISDAPLLPDVDGTEKIPTGGRGDYTISVDQIKGHIFQDIGKELVGLGNVDNTSDLDKPVSIAQQVALNLKADKTYVDTNLDLKADKTNVYTRSETSLALSRKADLVNGVVPESQIPSSFNDVLEFTTPNLPIIGESGKIYVTTDTDKTWRWATNKYVEISGWNPDSVSKRVTIPTYKNAVDGVNPVTGVVAGDFFNVLSEDDDTIAVEYQNVGGSPVVTGKRYLSEIGVQQQEKSASTIIDTSGMNQQEVNDRQATRNLDSRSIFDFLAGTNLADWQASKSTFDWSSIFQMAELYCRTYGGCKIRLPKRGSPYLLNGIAGQDGILNGLLYKHAGATNWRASTPSVVFEGEDQHVKLVAGSNNMHIVRMSSSFCSLQNVFLDQGGKTGVNALSLIPENTLSPHANSQQSYNYISNVSMWGTQEGVTLQCGGDGGCYYNEFHKVTYHGGNLNNTRAFYLKAGIPKDGGTYASPPNRNKFFSCDVSNCNTAYEIESGDTNSFYGCTAELINRGTAPNTVPTALKIKERDGSVNNWYNQGNTFYGFTAETCTRDLEIMNPYTHFFGCRAEASKSVVHANFGRNGTFFGTIGSSVFPQIYGGIVQRGDALPSGMDANYGLSVNDHFADQGFRQAGITLNTSNVSNVTAISGARSRFTRLNKVVDWHLRFQFTATNVNSAIEVTVPENMKPHIDLYCTYDTNAQMRFSIQRINQSNVTSGHYAHFNADGTKLVIPAPAGGWSTYTDNRYDGVFVQLRYFTA